VVPGRLTLVARLGDCGRAVTLAADAWIEEPLQWQALTFVVVARRAPLGALSIAVNRARGLLPAIAPES